MYVCGPSCRMYIFVHIYMHIYECLCNNHSDKGYQSDSMMCGGGRNMGNRREEREVKQ